MFWIFLITFSELQQQTITNTSALLLFLVLPIFYALPLRPNMLKPKQRPHVTILQTAKTCETAKQRPKFHYAHD